MTAGANTDPALDVVRETKPPRQDDAVPEADTWAVVHVPTGLMIVHGWATEEQARACMRRLSALTDWGALRSREDALGLPKAVEESVAAELWTAWGLE
jgi:hypothetical protein